MKRNRLTLLSLLLVSLLGVEVSAMNISTKSKELEKSQLVQEILSTENEEGRLEKINRNGDKLEGLSRKQYRRIHSVDIETAMKKYPEANITPQKMKSLRDAVDRVKRVKVKLDEESTNRQKKKTRYVIPLCISEEAMRHKPSHLQELLDAINYYKIIMPKDPKLKSSGYVVNPKFARDDHGLGRTMSKTTIRELCKAWVGPGYMEKKDDEQKVVMLKSVDKLRQARLITMKPVWGLPMANLEWRWNDPEKKVAKKITKTIAISDVWSSWKGNGHIVLSIPVEITERLNEIKRWEASRREERKRRNQKSCYGLDPYCIGN